MREIPLTQDQVAIVDDDDYNRVTVYKWHAMWSRHGECFKAARTDRSTGEAVTMLMHRFIMNTTQSQEIDHINGNSLDNRKENLRLATRQQNIANSRPRAGRKFKGTKQQGIRYQARILVNGSYIHLGTYNTEEDAARAYDKKAKELHGDFAFLNFP